MAHLAAPLALCGFNSTTCLKLILKLGQSTGKDNTENGVSFFLLYKFWNVKTTSDSEYRTMY